MADLGLQLGVERECDVNIDPLPRPEFPMVLVANKADLEGERVVSVHEGEGLALELKVWYMYDIYSIHTFSLS